mmetsp:Transcript_3731/g.8886  ORF Transcript_3731/g.8886 Transcript_3731/m.8886 type:complete len:296 (+) Transcript_3731:2854-3741(+)
MATDMMRGRERASPFPARDPAVSEACSYLGLSTAAWCPQPPMSALQLSGHAQRLLRQRRETTACAQLGLEDACRLSAARMPTTSASKKTSIMHSVGPAAHQASAPMTHPSIKLLGAATSCLQRWVQRPRRQRALPPRPRRCRQVRPRPRPLLLRPPLPARPRCRPPLRRLQFRRCRHLQQVPRAPPDGGSVSRRSVARTLGTPALRRTNGMPSASQAALQASARMTRPSTGHHGVATSSGQRLWRRPPLPPQRPRPQPQRRRQQQQQRPRPPPPGQPPPPPPPQPPPQLPRRRAR